MNGNNFPQNPQYPYGQQYPQQPAPQQTQQQYQQLPQQKKEVPEGIKILAVFYYASSFISLFVSYLAFYLAYAIETTSKGLSSLSGSSTSASSIQLIGDATGFASKGIFILILSGILLIGMSVLSYFIGRGLWKAKNWARILTIIFIAISIIGLVFTMIIAFSFILFIFIAINILIASYLLFSKKVKEAFASSPA